MIEAYVRDFSRWTAGSPEYRDTLVRELEAHLREAQQTGRLEETLERLGPAREAAQVRSLNHLTHR